MGRVREVLQKFSLLSPPRYQEREAEIIDELRFHLEMRTRDNVAAGMGADEARIDALRRFGNVAHITQQCLYLQDRHPLRTVLDGVRSVGILGLGMGAACLIFLFLTAIFVRLPLTYHNDHNWLAVWWEHTEQGFRSADSSLPHFLDWRAQSQALDHMMMAQYRRTMVTGEGEPAYVMAKFVSADYFALHGVAPLIGRSFLPEEVEFEAQQVAVLSYAFWQHRYHGDPGVLGQVLHADGQTWTIVGVMPTDFQMYHETAFFAPLAFGTQHTDQERRYLVSGRLKDGYTLAQAQAELRARTQAMAPQNPEKAPSWQLYLRPVQQVYSDPVRRPVLLLVSLAGLLLLVVCIHVFRHFLGRSMAQQYAGAQRVSRRLIGVNLLEGMLLAVAGGLLGLWMIAGHFDMISDSFLGSFARLFDLRLDGLIVGFTLSFSLFVGLLIGGMPTFLVRHRTPRRPVGTPQKQEARPRRRGYRLSKGLTIFEVSLALVFLIVAGLTTRSLLDLERIDPGYDPEEIVTLRVELPHTRYPKPADQARFFGEAFKRIEPLPGVATASLASAFPLGGGYQRATFTIEGRPPAEDPLWAYCNRVGRDYLDLMRIPLRQGRSFTQEDYRTADGRIVINEAAAAKYWPGEDPIGQRLFMGAGRWPLEVIGVAADVSQEELEQPPRPEIYLLYWRTGGAHMRLVVRAKQDPLAVLASVRQELSRLDPGLPLESGQRAAHLKDQILTGRRWFAGLLVLLAAWALLLTSMSVYHTIAEAVRAQIREIGLRKALGATSLDILALVLRPGVQVVGGGIVAGLLLTISFNRLLAGVLLDARPADPITYLVVLAVFIVIVLAVGYSAARKAMHIDPLLALRQV